LAERGPQVVERLRARGFAPAARREAGGWIAYRFARAIGGSDDDRMIPLLSDPGKLAGVELRVEGDAYRHLFRARRLAVGERLRVVDGRGRARWGDVARVARAAAVGG